MENTHLRRKSGQNRYPNGTDNSPSTTGIRNLCPLCKKTGIAGLQNLPFKQSLMESLS
jgi:hypothetical protein